MGEESDEKFNVLYRANYTRVHRLARRLVGADNADDVAQEVMIRAFRHIHLLDPTRPVWPWLAAVTQNAAMDHHRRRRGDLPANAADIERLTAPADDVVAQVLRSDARVRLSRALGRMPAFDRLLLTRHEMEGVPVAAIARSLGESPNALRQRLFRARRVLARHYRQLGGQYFWATPHVTARLASRRSRGHVPRPSVRAAVSLAVGGLLAGSSVVAPAGLPASMPQERRPPAAASPGHGPEGPLAQARESAPTLLNDLADVVHATAGTLRHRAHTRTRIAFGFDGAVDGWKYMPTARPACTGPARAGRCALVLDPVHMGATLACASRVHAISLGSRTRMAFSYYGDLGRVASSFEVAMDSGFFHVYFPDPAAGIGIEVVSNLGRATLPATTGTGRGWHLVTLDVDAVAPTLTLTVEGASATVPIDLGATLVTSMQLIGDPWAERTVPSTTPSAVRIDSMVIETVDPQPVPVVPAAPATKGGGVEAPGCPVAVDGIRPGSAVPHHQVG